MQSKKFTVLMFFLLILGFQSVSQEKYRVQAMFVYNFTRMTAWPQSYQTGDFVIGVYGNSPIFKEFSDLAAIRQVGSQRIVVKQYNSIADIDKCHIIFVAGGQSRQIADIATKLQQNKYATLVISESRNALDDGASVNFMMVNDRPRYELHEGNARLMGLSLGSEMTRLASAVK